MTVTRTVEDLPSIDPMTAAARLVRGLDRDVIAALVAFAESSRDGELVLIRERGEVTAGEVTRQRSQRSASGR